jgi:hypothetical protein
MDKRTYRHRNEDIEAGGKRNERAGTGKQTATEIKTEVLHK